MNGICPDCAGRVTSTSSVCEEHDPGDGEVCEQCQSTHPVTFLHVCTICRRSSRLTPWVHIFAHPDVQEFYKDRGFDSFGPDYFRIWPATIVEQSVCSTEPLELKIGVNIEGDTLEVTIDDTGNVVQVDHPSG